MYGCMAGRLRANAPSASAVTLFNMDESAALPRCYVASGLGFSEAGAHYYDHVYLPALAAVVSPVDPWALTTAHELAEARAQQRVREFALEIGGRNAEAIRSCTLLAAHLDGQELDSGTAAEVGFAAALGLRCFGLRTDIRESGEPGMSVNLQVEYFLLSSGGSICSSLAELVVELGSAAR
jgi:nucleoside 2-deoxyribosyltransferase